MTRKSTPRCSRGRTRRSATRSPVPRPNRNPTRREIARACLAIQSTWSDAERLRRAGLPVLPLEIPEVRTNDLRSALHDRITQ
jgi:hypothetical protein